MPTSNPSQTLHRPAPPAETLDPQHELALALELQKAGRLDEAEQGYDRILATVPDHAETLHFKGLVAHRRGRHAEAIELLREAIALNGGVFGWHSNLGNVLLLTGQGDAAADAYEQALSLAPERSDVHNNLGVLLGEQGRFEAAERTLRHAIELDPDSAEAHVNLARLLLRLSRGDEALVCLEPVLRLRPDIPMAHPWLGTAYRMLGRLGEATQVYRDWLVLDPEDPAARHYLAACAGEAVPERASDAYVERTFDTFAASFDKTLERLHYHGPELVAEAVAQRLGEPAQALDVLDAGCGTGLCGPLLKPYARRLVGIDLSQKMLDKARLRQDYDALEKAELTAYLDNAQPACCDLIASADTLCYFGELRAFFQAAAKALRPASRLVFTVEASEDGDGAAFRLHPHGRYSHRESYLREALAEAGLAIEGLERADLRMEYGKPVAGWVVSCKKEAPDL